MSGLGQSPAPRVLFLSSLTSDSGSGIRFWNMARVAARCGAKVTFLERRRSDQPPRQCPGIDYRSTRERLFLPHAIVASLRDGLRLARCGPWDAVWALKPLPNAVIPALRAGRQGARVALDVDDLDFEYYPPGVVRRLVRACFRAYPRRFDAVSYHVDPLREFLAGPGGVSPPKLFLVPQGVDLDVFAAQAGAVPDAIRVFLQRWQTMIYMASLGITSDFEDVLPVFREALQQHPTWGVLVLGHGVKLPAFRAAARELGLGERLLFTGHVPHEQVPAILAAGGAGVHYLRPGGANGYRAIMKIREYLAAGLPVVANLSGDAEAFRDFIELVAGADSYLGALERAMSQEAREKASRGRSFVRETLDWDKLAPRILTVLGLPGP